ncbi:biotin/lipoyl-binding protein [Vibrio sinaloensis]|nr:biotin/lipoyl-binding protein [Vibrio sinaloensis]
MKLNNKVLGAGLFALLAFLFVYMAGGFSDKIESAKRHHRLDIDKLETMTLVATQQVNKRVFFRVLSLQKQSADIAARLTANVVEVMVDVGDNVTKGDLLLRLESDDLDAIVEQSVQSLSSTQAQLNNVRKEYRRAEDLVKKKS